MIYKKGKNRGFTLIELVVVMVIIGILAVIAVPMYRGYVRRAMASEGRALVGSVASAEKIYYAQHQTFVAIPAGTSDASTLDLDGDGNVGDIDVDARSNKYFTTFGVTVGGGGDQVTITTPGAGDAAGITVTYSLTYGAQPTVTVAGL